MRRLMIILSMTVLLTGCIKEIKFDGFDPTTTTVRWMFTHDAKKN